MAKKDIKEYGDDLLNQYNELKKKQITLHNKVVKRFKFLLDNSGDPYLEGFTKEEINEYNTETMIFVIRRVEQNYVSQTTQLDMFNNKDKSND
jgi:hypothetical protein